MEILIVGISMVTIRVMTPYPKVANVTMGMFSILATNA